MQIKVEPKEHFERLKELDFMSGVEGGRPALSLQVEKV